MQEDGGERIIISPCFLNDGHCYSAILFMYLKFCSLQEKHEPKSAAFNNSNTLTLAHLFRFAY